MYRSARPTSRARIETGFAGVKTLIFKQRPANQPGED